MPESSLTRRRAEGFGFWDALGLTASHVLDRGSTPSGGALPHRPGGGLVQTAKLGKEVTRL